MKYLCHMTSSSDDERHIYLVEHAGLEGYGAYWIIAERIAGQIRPECSSISLQMSYKSWANTMKTHPLTARRLLRVLGESGLCLVEINGENVKVSMPNILKYADEYYRRVLKKSGQHPERLGTMSDQPEQPEQPEQPPAGGLFRPAGNMPNKDAEFSPQIMVDLWNKAIDFFSSETDKPKVPKVDKLTDTRRKKCNARISDCELDEAKWKKILNAIHHDDWLSGRKPSPKYPDWCADINFVIKSQDSITRILERC